MTAAHPHDSARSLPRSLSEYLLVWCADLLSPMSATQRQSLLDTIHLTYIGGPWPTRLLLQRLAEQVVGTISAEAAIGEVVATYGPSIDDTIEALTSGDDEISRSDLITLLARNPATTDLIPKVTAALHAGALTENEYFAICTQALHAPLLPDPIPAPPEFPELPHDYPESHEGHRTLERRCGKGTTI